MAGLEILDASVVLGDPPEVGRRYLCLYIFTGGKGLDLYGFTPEEIKIVENSQ